MFTLFTRQQGGVFAFFPHLPQPGLLTFPCRFLAALGFGLAAGFEVGDSGGDGAPVGQAGLGCDDQQQRGDRVDGNPDQVFFNALSAMFRANVMPPVIHRSVTDHRPPCPPRRASTESSRTTITTAASTTTGRIGAVHTHADGVCPAIKGVTVRTEYSIAPVTISHVPTDRARSAERT